MTHFSDLEVKSWVIDLNRFSDKAQVGRATLFCDSFFFLFHHNEHYVKLNQMRKNVNLTGVFS